MAVVMVYEEVTRVKHQSSNNSKTPSRIHTKDGPANRRAQIYYINTCISHSHSEYQTNLHSAVSFRRVTLHDAAARRKCIVDSSSSWEC